MYAGSILVSAVDETGKNQVDVLEVGDIWYFPKGSAHTIQGLPPATTNATSANLINAGLSDENEYLLAFDDGNLSSLHCFRSILTYRQGTLTEQGNFHVTAAP